MTCRIWRPFLSCCIKSKRHGHVEASFYFVHVSCAFPRNSGFVLAKASVNSRLLYRHILQDTGTLRWCLHHEISRPFLPFSIHIQLCYETVFHQQQLLYSLPHEVQIQVSRKSHSPPTPIILTVYVFRPTHDPSIDTFKIEYILAPCILFSLLFNYKFTVAEVLWSFSIWLEALAILPQLFMLQRTGEAETITTHYLAALGLYRALYIPNWIYRYGIFLLTFATPGYDSLYT